MGAMLEWISQHGTLAQVAVQIATALVWVGYLHVLIVNLRRQKRPNVVISRVAGDDDSARLLACNLGAEPIHVLSVVADVDLDGETRSVVIADHNDMSAEGDEPASRRTRKGPLDSGGYRDIGCFGDMLGEAMQRLGLAEREGEVDRLVLTVAAESGRDRLLVAGRQSFAVVRAGGRRVFLPQATRTEQIRSVFARRRLGRRLDAALREEAERAAREAEAAGESRRDGGRTGGRPGLREAA